MPPASACRISSSTGRTGPATWELGSFPQGQDEWPVSGLSYYEAAAYARFAGKALPTVNHWRQAAAFGINSQILEWSNFSGKSAARVGEDKGIGAFGTYDMAGTVKEWCTNAIGDLRYILGGGWNEPNYQYRQSDARKPFDRSANNGLRLVVFPDAAAVPDAARSPVEMQSRDYSKEQPVSDEVFAALVRLYAYDAGDLGARTKSIDDESDHWRIELVSYAAAYGGERQGHAGLAGQIPRRAKIGSQVRGFARCARCRFAAHAPARKCGGNGLWERPQEVKRRD